LGAAVNPKRWLLLVALACTRRDTADGHAVPVQSEAQVAAAQPARMPSSTEDVAVATRWLDALRDGDQRELAARTRFPFEIHDEGGSCKDQTAPSAQEMAAVVACLSSDAALMDLLRRHDSAAVEPLADIHFAAWRQKWHLTPTPNQRIVTGLFNREEARAHFDLWIADGGVRGVWKSGVSGSRDIEIATEWLAAVKERDFERLAKATSFPLEMRDTGRDARCGNRTVKGRDTLGAAIDCLFRSDRLHQAMVDTPSSGFTAYEPSDSLPDWVQAWWRDNEHQRLQRVATMVATADGYEYDFQMLVARDGVRVVWKLGSFESRY
jgi:hypothetical protein